MIEIQLVQGVTGGFMAAEPTKLITIEYNQNSSLVTKHTRSDAPGAQDGYLETKSSPSNSIVEPIVFHVLNTLKELPMEKPMGCMDLYGFDTSIQITADGFVWKNTPNQGCNIVQSEVGITSDQRQAFKQLIDKILELGDL